MPKLVQEIANKVFTRAYRGYDEREVDAFLDDLMGVVERYEAELEGLRGSSARLAKESLDSLAEGSGERRLGEARLLLNGLIDDVERIMDNASAEAERIVESANTQAERIARDANAEAARIIESANAEVTRILEAAKEEAAAIIGQANEEAAERMHRADREADNLLADAGRISRSRLEFDLGPAESRAKHAAGSAAKAEDTINDLTKRINELTKRLESIEGTETKPKETPRRSKEPQVREDWIPAEQREAMQQAGQSSNLKRGDDKLYHRPYNGEGNEAFLSAFNREEYRSATHAPWTDWLPSNTSAEEIDEDDDRVRFTDADWNTVE